MSVSTVLGSALEEFIEHGEIVLEHSSSSLLITDSPLPILRDWRGTVLTAHRNVEHPNRVTELPTRFKASEALVALAPLSAIQKWQIDTALAVTSGNVTAIAENRRGAERLSKLVGKEEHPELRTFSRNHCRAVVTAHAPSAPSDAFPILAASAVAGWENILALPGVFSADRADRGTEMLRGCALQMISENSKIKTVLDLGCGCGVLGISVLERVPSLQVDFVDIDFRAVFSTKLNLENRGLETSNAMWLDATRERLSRERYDLVLLNPPFHAHGQEHRELGRKMIERALELTAGELLIVGNTHLGYGSFLPERAVEVQELITNNQFTVWAGRRKK